MTKDSPQFLLAEVILFAAWLHESSFNTETDDYDITLKEAVATAAGSETEDDIHVPYTMLNLDWKDSLAWANRIWEKCERDTAAQAIIDEIEAELAAVDRVHVFAIDEDGVVIEAYVI